MTAYGKGKWGARVRIGDPELPTAEPGSVQAMRLLKNIIETRCAWLDKACDASESRSNRARFEKAIEEAETFLGLKQPVRQRLW